MSQRSKVISIDLWRLSCWIPHSSYSIILSLHMYVQPVSLRVLGIDYKFVTRSLTGRRSVAEKFGGERRQWSFWSLILRITVIHPCNNIAHNSVSISSPHLPFPWPLLGALTNTQHGNLTWGSVLRFQHPSPLLPEPNPYLMCILGWLLGFQTIT